MRAPPARNAAVHLIEASLDEDLRQGFVSTYSLVDFSPTATSSSGKKPAVVHGVGRRSLVDPEQRTYAFKPLDKPPPPKHAR